MGRKDRAWDELYDFEASETPQLSELPLNAEMMQESLAETRDTLHRLYAKAKRKGGVKRMRRAKGWE